MNTLSKFITTGIFLSIMLVLTFIFPAVTNAQYYGCTYHAYQSCSGNYLYWYDACGNQQDVAQFCAGGCSNNTCLYSNNNNYNSYSNYNNYNNYPGYNNYNAPTTYGACTYHAYRQCVGSNVYWYDSCGVQQDLFTNCTGSQVCQYGQCTVTPQIYIAPVAPAPNYVAHFRTACYGNSLYWYDSLGASSGLYKSCADNNSCTADTCSENKCSSAIKCDGSTCATNSADYTTFCATNPTDNPNHCGNKVCDPSLGETVANCAVDCAVVTNPPVTTPTTITPAITTNHLSISLFAKKDQASPQWQKTAEVDSGNTVYFMISVTNNSTAQADSVIISANIPTEISSLGNVQLNGVPMTGDIVSGISIGSLSPNNTKSMTFEGVAQTISVLATKQAFATINNVSNPAPSDYIPMTFNPTPAPVNNTPAAVSGTVADNGFWSFTKRWYLWILGAVVLIFLFVMVFKRLSSDV